MENINLAIIEDDKVIRNSLIDFLGRNTSINVISAQNSMESFMDKYKNRQDVNLDILLLDIGLPGMSGLEGIRHIKSILPKLNIIMLSTFEEEDKIFKALCAGAVSYISKRTSLTKIEDALFTIYRGGSYMSPSIARKVIGHFNPKSTSTNTSDLSPRQIQIIDAIVEGLSYKMIADKYLISINTVRDHIKKIYRTLQINSKAELIKKSNDGF